MGKSYTPKYRVELSDVTLPNGRIVRSTPEAWRSKDAGRPTAKNLEKYIQVLHDSYKIGGCNEHISKSYGIILIHNSARIVRQYDDEVIATWKAPMFMVV